MTQNELSKKRHSRQMQRRRIALGIARDKHVNGPQKRAQKAENRRLMSHFLLTQYQSLTQIPPENRRLMSHFLLTQSLTQVPPEKNCERLMSHFLLTQSLTQVPPEKNCEVNSLEG